MFIDGRAPKEKFEDIIDIANGQINLVWYETDTPNPEIFDYNFKMVINSLNRFGLLTRFTGYCHQNFYSDYFIPVLSVNGFPIFHEWRFKIPCDQRINNDQANFAANFILRSIQSCTKIKII